MEAVVGQVVDRPDVAAEDRVHAGGFGAVGQLRFRCSEPAVDAASSDQDNTCRAVVGSYVRTLIRAIRRCRFRDPDFGHSLGPGVGRLVQRVLERRIRVPPRLAVVAASSGVVDVSSCRLGCRGCEGHCYGEREERQASEQTDQEHIYFSF